jgi:hypothetical protein
LNQTDNQGKVASDDTGVILPFSPVNIATLEGSVAKNDPLKELWKQFSRALFLFALLTVWRGQLY